MEQTLSKDRSLNTRIDFPALGKIEGDTSVVEAQEASPEPALNTRIAAPPNLGTPQDWAETQILFPK